jgi:endoribonuclease LACTB2
MSQAIQVSPTTWSLALRTPTLPPATSTNTVAFVGESMVVVEPATPFAEQQRSLDAFIEARRVEGHPVQGLLITHHHADHTGYVRDLRQRLGVPLLAHGETAVRVPFEVDAWIEDGEVIDLGAGVSLEAVLTPGHAPGHLVFVERSTAVAHVGEDRKSVV